MRRALTILIVLSCVPTVWAASTDIVNAAQDSFLIPFNTPSVRDAGACQVEAVPERGYVRRGVWPATACGPGSITTQTATGVSTLTPGPVYATRSNVYPGSLSVANPSFFDSNRRAEVVGYSALYDPDWTNNNIPGMPMTTVTFAEVLTTYWSGSVTPVVGINVERTVTGGTGCTFAELDCIVHSVITGSVPRGAYNFPLADGAIIFGIGFCGELLDASFTTSTITPSNLQLSIDESFTCGQVGQYIFTGQRPGGLPAAPPHQGYASLGYREGAYYDLPLNAICSSYEVRIVERSDGDWLAPGGWYGIPRTGNVYRETWSNAGNAFTLEINLGANGAAQSIRTRLADGSGGSGGLAFLVRCRNPTPIPPPPPQYQWEFNVGCDEGYHWDPTAAPPGCRQLLCGEAVVGYDTIGQSCTSVIGMTTTAYCSYDTTGGAGGAPGVCCPVGQTWDGASCIFSDPCTPNTIPGSPSTNDPSQACCPMPAGYWGSTTAGQEWDEQPFRFY
jgi:hypothetical protein